jgi:hypothetical protein
MTILWEFRKLQGKLISLRSSTQLENLLSLRLQPANRSNLILFSDALLKAVNRLHRQKAPCSADGQPWRNLAQIFLALFMARVVP